MLWIYKNVRLIEVPHKFVVAYYRNRI